MSHRTYRFLANLILAVHIGWFAFLVLSPLWLTAKQILLIGVALVVIDVPLGGCPITTLELWLRERSDEPINRASLGRRLWSWVGLRLTEGETTRLEVVLFGLLMVQAFVWQIVR